MPSSNSSFAVGAALSLPSHLRVTQISDEDPTPSFFIRFRDPIELLTKNWNYVRSSDFDLANRMLKDADVVVVQRAFNVESQWLVETAKAAGKPVIYETDNLMLDLPPQSGFRLSETQKKAIKSMLKAADVVTCSTSALSDALSEHNQNVTVLRNYAVPFPIDQIRSVRTTNPHLAIVNTDYFKLIDRKSQFFAALREALRQMKYNVTFFGSIDPLMERLRTEFPKAVRLVSSFIPWRKAFLSYLLKSAANVAIVPLEKNPHHRFKSDVKFLDFASIGIPAIFNNEQIYGRVIHKQNGFMCDGTYDGWIAGLAYFADEAKRITCGDSALSAAYERTIETYAEEYRAIVMRLSCCAPDQACVETVAGNRDD